MKKKLLFINGHLNTGGVEKALVDVLRHIDYERFDVDLLLLEALGDYEPQLPKAVRVILHPLQNTYGSLLPCLARCLRRRDWFSLRMRLIFLAMKIFGQKHIALAGKMLLGNRHYDCAVGFRPGICTQVAAFAADADRRITWWHHGIINVSEHEFPEAALRCSAVSVVSDACREMLIQKFPMLESHLVTIPNIIDTSSILRMSGGFIPYPDDQLRHIISVGSMFPNKHFLLTYQHESITDNDICFN